MDKKLQTMQIEIDSLKEKVSDLEQQRNSLWEKIYQYQESSDEKISPMKKQFELKIETLEKTLEVKNKLYEKLQKRDTAKAEKIIQLEKEIGIQKSKNERGAGRKKKFTREEMDEIKVLREKGFSISKLAEQYKCSSGLIHKIVNER